jgi:uncharacterized protein
MLLAVLPAAASIAVATACARAAEVPIPPSPTTWVTDNAGLLTPATRDALNTRLANYDHATGHQVIVWIGTTTGDTPLEDWTIHAFTAWKVGRKGLDDGLALFMFTQDRKVRIEVGYGLESIVTDALSSRIIRNEIVPRMKQGDADGAVSTGVSALLAAIGGEQGAPPERASQSNSSSDSAFWVIGLTFFIFFLIVAALVRAGRRYYTVGSGPMWFGGGSSGGGWGGFSGGGGFGGFSGGGGMGGGGGASGGW